MNIKNVAFKKTDASPVEETMQMHGPAVEILSLTEAVSRLFEHRLLPQDRTSLWVRHDAIVNHSKRNAVSRDEALRLIELMGEHMPVTIARMHEDSVEYLHLAVDSEGPNSDVYRSYVWCSTYLPFDLEEPCATCIADETSLPELISVLSSADNVS
ncbi:hypothetical protein PXK56_18205 [Phaeobacter gallaeciensis]|uniref:hypothetical protein n=1 Tax=Phaeobacter gallaeciensis TaxID=60890 RepID=UPI002380707A|nr:hypothetical protein [Phaeobacter gallaeciensis]MDE4297120.1 hypothetical protein [Phaeobacter gallaeciensis]